MYSRFCPRALLMISLHSFLLVSCSRGSETRPSRSAESTDAGVVAPVAAARMTRQALTKETTRLLGLGDTEAALKLLDVEESAGAGKKDDLRAWQVAHMRATAHAYRGDLDAASRVLDAHLEATKGSQDGIAFYLRSSRTWVKWSQQDLQGALAELEAMEAIAATWSETDRKDAMLHVLWDRAYLTLDLILHEADPKARQALLQRAKEFRNAYEQAAQPASDNVVGRAAIGVRFALAAGDAAGAMALAKQIEGGEADPQDLHLAANAYLAGGDIAHARVLRARIADNPQLMAALVLRDLDRLIASPPATKASPSKQKGR